MHRHASATYRQRRVDVSVSPLAAGSLVEVVVHDPGERVPDQLLEYIVDEDRFDDAVDAGMAFARELIDGRRH
jgi:hypothetical protein